MRQRKALGAKYSNTNMIPMKDRESITKFNSFLTDTVIKNIMDTKRNATRTMYKGAGECVVKVDIKSQGTGTIHLLYRITKNKEEIKKIDKDFKKIEDIKKEIEI